MAIRMVNSKLAKTRVLLKVTGLRRYIPETKPLTKETLHTLIEKHRVVFVKPDRGKGGVGVMRATRKENNCYSLHHNIRTTIHSSIPALYRAILRTKSKKTYLVQQGIPLLKYNKRPFDIRVMVQRNPNGIWETTGIMGRLAHPLRVVTNYHSGGTPMDYSVLMAPYLTTGQSKQLYQTLSRLGLEVAHVLKNTYPGIKEVGLDVALDSELHPWILEVNTLPNPFLFRNLKEKSVYRRIYRYAAAYGRFNKRYCPKMAGKKPAK